LETGSAAALEAGRQVAAFRVLPAFSSHSRVLALVNVRAAESVAFVTRETGAEEAAQGVGAMSEHVARSVPALIFVGSGASATAVSVVTVAFVIEACAVLAFSSLGQHAVGCAFQFGAILVGSPEAIRLAVAQLGDVVELKDVRRFVHLAAEVAFL